MSDLHDDIRATGEDIAAEAARLTEIEGEKSSLGVDDPRQAELSAEGEAIARRLVPKTAAERALADDVLPKEGPAA